MNAEMRYDNGPVLDPDKDPEPTDKCQDPEGAVVFGLMGMLAN